MDENDKQFVAQSDNTRVFRVDPRKLFKLTPEQIQEHNKKKIQEQLQKNQAYIYDKDKIDYYTKMQDFYNQNVFGNGLQGTQTRYNPYTSQGQQAIQAAFDQSRSNAVDFLANTSGIGVGQVAGKIGLKTAQVYNRLTRGVFRTPAKNGSLGTLAQYAKNPIGSGAEAVVIENTPTTVGKMTSIPVEEMALRNSVPNAIPNKYIGYVTEGSTKLPTYIQTKLKILTDKTFPQYIQRLDRAMKKSGFRKVEDPALYGRAYTNGKVVIDDVAPGNVGITTGYPWLDKILPDFMKKPKIVDMIYQSADDWKALGYSLKKGGKIPKGQSGVKTEHPLRFVRSYYNSPGFKERFHNNVLREFKESEIDEYPEFTTKILYKRPLRFKKIVHDTESSYDEDDHIVRLSKPDKFTQLDGYNNEYDILAHELGHAVENSIDLYGQDKYSKVPYGRYAYVPYIFRNNKYYKSILNNLDSQNSLTFLLHPMYLYEQYHDAQPTESYADLMALRYMLNRYNIYDSRKANNPFTQKHLDKIKKINPKFRLFDTFNDKDIIEMMNTVADNTDYNNQDDNLMV